MNDRFFTWAVLATALLMITACDARTGSGAASSGEVVEVLEETPEPEHRPEHGPIELDNGGVTEIPRDVTLAAEGERLFEAKTCGECHSMDRPKRGPPLGGITHERTPQWLARMIMHPERMVRLDPVAKAQLSEYMCMMPNLDVTPDETRALLAFLATQPAPSPKD